MTADAYGQDRTQLAKLATPFPDQFIEGKDGQNYVAHHVITQRLLDVVGPFDFELVREIRSDVPAVPPDPNARSRRAKAGTPALSNIVVGVVGRLTAEVDGRQVRVEEVGDVGDVHNWAHDGARLKDAASDALKRCAMRLGLGLHLWAQEHYFLDAQLSAAPPQETAAPQESEPGGASTIRNALPDEQPTAASAEGTGTPPGPVADGTPPGFDHLSSVEDTRAWIKEHRELWPLIREDAHAQGIDPAEASLETLRELILGAWRVQQVVQDPQRGRGADFPPTPLFQPSTKGAP